MIRDTASQDRPLAQAAARPRRRWAVAAVAAMAGLVTIAFGARAWLASAGSVDRGRLRIAEVRRGTLVRDIAADGRVTAANSPTLYAVAAGTVKLEVLAGDAVERDQVLATLSSPELESRLAQEQASLAGLEAEVGRAELDLEQGRARADRVVDLAEVDRQIALRELERTQHGYQAGVFLEIDVLRARAGLNKTEISLAHANKDVSLQRRGLSFDLRIRRQTLDRQREVVRELSRQVESLVIRSPVDGQVGQVMVAQRAKVAASAPVLTVVDLTAYELEIRVPDSFARDLAIGMAAEIRAGEATYSGRVRSVSPEVVSGEVASRLEFLGEKPAGLRQNQRLTARVLLDEKPGVLMVERGPFVETGGGTVAYLVRDGVAERRSIRTGAVSLDAVELLSGAEVGDRIVVSGADAFGDTERVRIAGE